MKLRRYVWNCAVLLGVMLCITLYFLEARRWQRICIASGMNTYEIVDEGTKFEVLHSTEAPFNVADLTSPNAPSEPVVPSADGPVWLVIYTSRWFGREGKAYLFSSNGGNAVEYAANMTGNFIVVGEALRRLMNLDELSDKLQTQLIREGIALGHSRYDPSKSPFE